MYFLFKGRGSYKEPFIIYHRGVGGGGRVEDFGADHLIVRRTKGGSVITQENPKGRIAENFGRIQRGDHSNVLGK